MWRCLFDYCDLHGIDPAVCRVDLVAIELDAGGRVVAIEHFRALELAG
jgi:hypothetical protein